MCISSLAAFLLLQKISVETIWPISPKMFPLWPDTAKKLLKGWTSRSLVKHVPTTLAEDLNLFTSLDIE